jgi:hypothetical protein
LSLSETERAGRAADAVFVEHRGRRRRVASDVAHLLTTDAVVAEELMTQPGAIAAPGSSDPAEGPDERGGG